MLSGERRWASARRGGMTVLGKVAVPKPLNLPSQRLENHGLDPNVEIVPKGTLGWGSRPSSSGSNPWVSSSLSPGAEGGTISPSHLSSRPSSGGSGTRPSTAGSEKSHEPVSSGVWGSNSRPSSASGTLSSNQTSSASLRPRSADNRPNSSQSQLSRFADQDNKNSAAWAPNVTAERLGVKSSMEDGFSLTSGDFPTLGTAKDNSMAITELEDHGRPSSASGRIAHGKEETRSDAKHGTMNAWRADGPHGPDNDIHPSMDKWHGDNPPHYFNPNAPPQHFDVWRGPPMNDPSGAWYRGRPRGPPFGPRGFPMEPFPYYRHQMSTPPLVGSQPGLLPGPRGSHPKNGDLYRPGMPFRPGFYPGQPAFESFYGPPMGYERDVPYMGMPAGPPVYNNSYPGPGPDIGNSHGREGHDHRHHPSKTSEEVEANDTQGTKKITLKTRNQCDQWEEGESWEHNLQQEKKCFPTSIKNEWGAEEEEPEEAVYVKKRSLNEKFSQGYDYRAHSSDGVKVKSIEGMGNAKAVNDTWTNVSESVEMRQVPLGSVRDPSLPALMRKIDGLNAKIRVSDGWNDSPGPYNRDRSQTVDTKIKNSTGEVSKAAGSFEMTPASRDIVSSGDKPIQPVIALSRRQHQGGQARVDHRGKGKFSNQDSDGWRKKPLTTESSNVIKASHNESPPISRTHGPDNVEVASEISVINPVLQIVGGSIETHDSIDIQAQVKTREIPKQRALQLQREEEERIKEQRAKSLAKLDELNRRTVAGEVGTEKAEKIQIINGIQGEQNESRVANEPSIADHNNATEMPKNLPVESDFSTSLPVQDNTHDVSIKKAAPQYNDSRHKRAGYKQKQNSSLQKGFTEKSARNVAANNDITSGEHYPSSETKLSESNMPNTSEIVVERPAPQRRNGNRTSKNKQRPDEILLPPVESSVNPVSQVIEPEPEPNRAVKAREVLSSSLPNKESHISRQPRGRQVNNKPHGSGDTVVWAPVNKANVSVEANPDAVPESTNSRKGYNNNVNEKRAEMERYVPKPVAKELAQQVYTPNVSVNDGEIISHNKHRKYHGMRKQSYRMKGESQPEKRDFVKVNAEIKTRGPDDGYNLTGSNNANTAENPSVKDQGATGRGNRNNRQFRDNRQSQNPHYEYQSVGPFKVNRPGREEELNGGADSTGLEHRERGPRRGGGRFSRRQSGPVPAYADAGRGD